MSVSVHKVVFFQGLIVSQHLQCSQFQASKREEVCTERLGRINDGLMTVEEEAEWSLQCCGIKQDSQGVLPICWEVLRKLSGIHWLM